MNRHRLFRKGTPVKRKEEKRVISFNFSVNNLLKVHEP